MDPNFEAQFHPAGTDYKFNAMIAEFMAHGVAILVLLGGTEEDAVETILLEFEDCFRGDAHTVWLPDLKCFVTPDDAADLYVQREVEIHAALRR